MTNQEKIDFIDAALMSKLGCLKRRVNENPCRACSRNEVALEKFRELHPKASQPKAPCLVPPVYDPANVVDAKVNKASAKAVQDLIEHEVSLLTPKQREILRAMQCGPIPHREGILKNAQDDIHDLAQANLIEVKLVDGVLCAGLTLGGTELFPALHEYEAKAVTGYWNDAPSLEPSLESIRELIELEERIAALRKRIGADDPTTAWRILLAKLEKKP